MSIDWAKKTIPTPFGGAEFNLSLTLQIYSAPPNGAGRALGPRAINMLPLRGETLKISSEV